MGQITVDDIVLKVVFLLHMSTSLLANTYLLFMHIFVLFTRHRLKTTELILYVQLSSGQFLGSSLQGGTASDARFGTGACPGKFWVSSLLLLP